MVQANKFINRLQSSYLFPEITKQKNLFLERHPNAKLINLSIGDTSLPLPHNIAEAIKAAAHRFSTIDGYQGYGPDQGLEILRNKIAETFYPQNISAADLFITDGSKCDISRLQNFFGQQITAAIQNPAYPVYVDGSVLNGQTKEFNHKTQGYEDLHYLNTCFENQFFPDLSKLKSIDLIYWCSPHNPTGIASTREQLSALVEHAKRCKALIIYDSAYAFFIQDPELPKSIYEIEGADEVAIEVGSFSKLAGFTGIRLGWTIVPQKLVFEDGSPIKSLWSRYLSTVFNGASLISQYAGVEALSEKGLESLLEMRNYYLENAEILRQSLPKSWKVADQTNAPYVWAKTDFNDSWDGFRFLLKQAHLVCVPGRGFGTMGEGCIRLSCFAQRGETEEAANRLQELAFTSTIKN